MGDGSVRSAAFLVLPGGLWGDRDEYLCELYRSVEALYRATKRP
jgi:hypothetical protein